MTTGSARREILSDQIVQVMVQRIRRGEWSTLDKLPPEQDLCQIFGVSRVTIRQALKVLESRGLVTAKHGKGTFINRTPSMVHAGLQELKSITETIRDMGLTPSMKYMHRNIRKSTPEEAESMDLPAGAGLLTLRRKIYADDQVAAYLEDVMPMWVFGNDFDPLSLTGSVFSYLDEHTDIRPRRAIAHIHARSRLSTYWYDEDQLPDQVHGPFILLDQMQYDTLDRFFMHTSAYFVDGRFDFVVLRLT